MVRKHKAKSRCWTLVEALMGLCPMPSPGLFCCCRSDRGFTTLATTPPLPSRGLCLLPKICLPSKDMGHWIHATREVSTFASCIVKPATHSQSTHLKRLAPPPSHSVPHLGETLFSVRRCRCTQPEKLLPTPQCGSGLTWSALDLTLGFCLLWNILLPSG